MSQNRNIELGTFTWDDNKLSNQIAANYLEMQRLSNVMKEANQSIKQAGNTIKDLEKKIESEQRAQARLSDQLENGYITQEKYNEEIEKSNRIIDGFIDQQQEAIRSQANYALEVTRTGQELRVMRQEQTELNNLMSAGRTEIQGVEGAYKELNRELNALKQEAKNVGAEMLQLERSGQKDSDRYRELATRFAEVSEQARELNDQFVELDESVGDNQRKVGAYKEAINSALTDIVSGVRQMASGDVIGGFESVQGGIEGITKNFKVLFNFIKANPWLLIVGAIFSYVKEMYEYNQQVRELNTEVEQLANTSGKLTDELRKNATAIQESYGKDFKEAVIEQKSLMDDFGVSAKEAFDIYNQGLALGGAQNAEFGDSIREYGPLFAQNGYAAQEFVNILNSGIDLGIYSDKLPDAIKEAGLSLKEQTKATRDALINAFGASFSDDLLKRIQSGKTTVADGLDEIAKKSRTMHLNEQQLAQLTADVFKGAGEDAGGVLKVFEALNHAQEINAESLTEIQKQVVRLAELDRDLADAKDEAFKSDSMMAFQADVEVVWKEIQIAWYKALGGITTFLEGALKGWKLAVMNTTDFIKLIPVTFNKVVVALSQDLTNLAGLAKLSGQIIKDALNFNFDAAEAKFDQLKKGISNVFSNTKKEIKEFSSNLGVDGKINTKNTGIIKSQEAAKIELERQKEAERARQKAEAERQKNSKTTGSVADAEGKAASDAAKAMKKAETERQRELEKQRKEQERIIEQESKRMLDIARAEAEQKSNIAKSELANYIAVNAEKLNNDKTLNKSRLQEQLAYYDEVKKMQSKANEEERKSKEFALQQKIDEISRKKTLNENDKNEIANLKSEIDVLNKDYATKEIELTNETNSKKKDLNSEYETQVQDQRNLSQAIEFQQRILNLESQGASEFEIQKEQENQRFQNKLAQWAEENQIKLDLDNNNEISREEIQLQRDELQNQYNLAKDDAEKERIKNKLDAIDFMVAEHGEYQKRIDKAVTDAKISGFATVFGAARQAFGEQTAVGKAAAIAETTINTYKAAQSAYSSLAGIPIVGPALGAAAAAFAVVQGLANVRKIVSVKSDKAAKGTVISGPSHANGGVPIMTPNGMIEAEGGEVIINKRSSALYRDELSAINQAGGGVKFANGGVIGSNLATVQNSFTKSIDFTEMANVIGEKVLEGSAVGTSTGSQEGFENLSQNRKIATNSNY